MRNPYLITSVPSAAIGGSTHPIGSTTGRAGLYGTTGGGQDAIGEFLICSSAQPCAWANRNGSPYAIS
jgi:hypothetical protein